jgi:RNA-directed DNA polymerase
MVMGAASPDDPALDQYWARRRRTSFSLLGGLTASLLRRQQGRCPACGTFLLHAEHGPQSPQEWEQWTRTLRRALSVNALLLGNAPGDDRTVYRLTHAHCHHRIGNGPNKNQPTTPEGLA